MCVDDLKEAFQTLKRVVSDYLVLEEKEGGAADDQGDPSGSAPEGDATSIVIDS